MSGAPLGGRGGGNPGVGVGGSEGDRGEGRWSGSVEVRLAFTGRRFVRLKLDNCPAGVPVVPEIGVVGAGVTAVAVAAEGGVASSAAASAADKVKKEGACGTQASLSVLPSLSGGAVPRAGAGGGSGVGVGGGGGGGGVVGDGGAVCVGIGGSSSGGRGVGDAVGEVFSPTPLVGPRPALARGGWASLASSTAAATTAAAAATAITRARAADNIAKEGRAGGNKGGGGGGDSDDDGGEGARERWMSNAAAWVNRPASVVAHLRDLLLPTPASAPASGSSVPALGSALGKKHPGLVVEGPGGEKGRGGGRPALVSLLEGGVCMSPAAVVSAAAAKKGTMVVAAAGVAGGSREAGCTTYAAGLRTDALEQLAGKMRLLLRADLWAGGDRDEGVEGVKLGLGEFVSLVEDVHRSVERTTRQR